MKVEQVKMVRKMNNLLCGGYMTKGKVEIVCDFMRKYNIDCTNEDIDTFLRTISVIEDYN